MSPREDQMMKRSNGGPDPDASLERELAGLRQDYERLREEKVRAEQDLVNLDRSLRDLEEKAKAEYGTADPAELARLLESRRAENARLVAEYRAHLQGINAGLNNIEQAGD